MTWHRPRPWRRVRAAVMGVVWPVVIVARLITLWRLTTASIEIKDAQNFIDKYVRPLWLIGGALADILDWCFAVVGEIFDAVWAAMGVGFGLVSASLTSTWNFFTAAVSSLVSAASWAYNMITTTVPKWIDSVYQSALGVIQNYVNTAWQWVQGVLNTAANWIDTLWQQVLSYVWDPLWNFVSHAADIVGGWIADGLNTFYNAVVAPVVGDLRKAWDLIDTLWSWFDTEARDVLHVVERAWDWIVYAAEHPFSWFTDLADSTNGSGGHWIADKVVELLDSGRDTVDAAVARWIDRM